MAEVIFLVIVAICIIALFAIEGNRAKQLEKLENRIEFLQDRLLELATRTDIQDALLKLKANDPDRKLLKVTNKETGNVKLRVITKDGKEIQDVKLLLILGFAYFLYNLQNYIVISITFDIFYFNFKGV